MAAASRVMGVVEVVGAVGGKHDVMVDLSGVWSFFPKVNGVVRMLVMCLVSSSKGLCVVCEFTCDWFNERLSRAMRLRRMDLSRSVMARLF
jgi:hypothetical protein